MKQDLHDNVKPLVGRNYVNITSNTTTAGTIVDRNGYRSAECFLFSGAVTDGTYTPLIQDGNDSGLSDGTAVDDTFLLGTEANAALTAANTIKRVGYNGHKRYLRCQIVSTGVTTGGNVGAFWVFGHPLDAPVA